jgi:hypothetical protein
MPNRSAKFATALLTSIVVAGGLATATDAHAQTAADNCLSSPKSTTPAGGHWYYRIDHVAKRKCWYLRDENGKKVSVAPQASSSAAESSAATTDPASSPPGQAVGKSIADAHAELPPPQAGVEQDPSTAAEPQSLDATAAEENQGSPSATTPDAAGPTSPVATRWPDATTFSLPGRAVSAAAEPPAVRPKLADAAPPSQPAIAPVVAPVAADPTMAKQAASMQMLFLVMAGALALAGITASLVFRFGTASHSARSARDVGFDPSRTFVPSRTFFASDVPRRRYSRAAQQKQPVQRSARN